MRILLSALLLLLAGAGESAAANDDDVAVTWTRAIVAVRIETPDLRRVVLGGRIDAGYIVDILDGMSAKYPQPAVIFLHDCGYAYNDPEGRQQIKFMASLGYIVFVPDSYARAGRPRSCDVETKTLDPTLSHDLIHEQRRSEALYAIERVLELPWIDHNKIYLGGSGEGADAALQLDHEALAGRFAISPSCTYEVRHTPSTPTLIVRSDRDLWYDIDHWPEAIGACETTFRNDAGTEIVVVDGALHDPLIYPEAKTRFWNFMVRAAFF
jgi:dienelactone hydrolase